MRDTWNRWKFHANALVLLVPLAFLPNLFRSDEPARAGAEPAVERDVGPWHVTVSEIAPTGGNGADRRARRFAVSFRDGYPQQIRAAFIRFGKPGDAKAAGVLLKGNPFRLQAQLPPPKTEGDGVWLTAEGWDGSVHQARIPLASP